MDKVEHENADSEFAARVIELLEGLLLRRFPELKREGVRTMFELHDIRKSKFWQQARQSGIEEKQDEIVRKCLAKGMSAKEVAELLEIPLKETRRIAKQMQS